MFAALSRLLLAFAAAIAFTFNDGDVGVVGETIEGLYVKIGQFGAAPQIDGQRGGSPVLASVQQESYRGGTRSAALQCLCQCLLQRLGAVVLSSPNS